MIEMREGNADLAPAAVAYCLQQIEAAEARACARIQESLTQEILSAG